MADPLFILSDDYETESIIYLLIQNGNILMIMNLIDNNIITLDLVLQSLNKLLDLDIRFKIHIRTLNFIIEYLDTTTITKIMQNGIVDLFENQKIRVQQSVTKIYYQKNEKYLGRWITVFDNSENFVVYIPHKVNQIINCSKFSELCKELDVELP
ncbi:MAG: hypothetical protein H0X03_09845 [Nitrosopumilus sp.]|nr:hypothetical protein [Nitrosopumilus sp.]